MPSARGARRVDVVVNRLAHHLTDDGGLRRKLVQAAEAAGAGLHETRSLGELDQAAATLATRGTDAVVLAGGDGSYMAGLTALERAFGADLPPIGFAPGGTVSTVARNWGYRGTMGAYGTRLVHAAVEGRARTTPRPTLRVRDAAGRSHLALIFGTGLVASFFDAYYASDHQGYASAAGIVARVFAGSFVGGELAERILRPLPCTVFVEGVEHPPRAYSLVAASVVRDLGLHMRVLYRAAEESERFHVVASPLDARRLGPQLPLVLAGRRLRGQDHIDTLAREVRVVFTGDRSVYVIDGEVFTAREVTVGAGSVFRHLSV